jgi:hypothetical protein
LKDVAIQKAILFPLEGSDGKAYEWRDIYYIHLDTGELCHTIFKTYSLPIWNELQLEISNYAKENKIEPSTLDYTDFAIEMVVEVKKDSKGKDRNIIRFYIASDEEGEPISVMDDRGKYRKGITVNRIKGESYDNMEKFVTENYEKIYDVRLLTEYAERNFKAAYDSMAAEKKNLFVAACGAKLGYYSKETAKAIAQPKADVDLLD